MGSAAEVAAHCRGGGTIGKTFFQTVEATPQRPLWDGLVVCPVTHTGVISQKRNTATAPREACCQRPRGVCRRWPGDTVV